jgi:Fe2+ or Zn2+ uptake regulation protein
MPRPSPVTDAVRDLFHTPGRHAWSIDELHSAVRSDRRSTDYSSVFRAVSMLQREGVIDRIDLGEGHARFELRDGHHEHIRCESCGRVDEVPGCVLDDVVARTQAMTGFTVTSHKVVFAGVCPECVRTH